MCWLALADVIQGGITFRLINLDMLFTTAHQLSYQAFLPRLAGTPFIFLSPQHLDIWSGPVILMSIVTPGVCLYCSDVSLLHCLPIPAASPRGVKGVMMALFTQLSVLQSLAKL